MTDLTGAERVARTVDFLAQPVYRITWRAADDWTCLCGNEAHLDGFYPCLPDGTEVEPTIDGPWDGVRYVCNGCGRIVDQRDGTILGQITLPVGGLS